MKQTKPMHHISWDIRYTVYRGMLAIKRKTQTWPNFFAKSSAFREGRREIPACCHTKNAFSETAVNIARNVTKENRKNIQI